MTVADRTSGCLVQDRTVYTYGSPPAGVLTGYVNGAAFVLEHVIRFPTASPGILPDMLRAGLREAWHQGFDRVTFYIPEDFEEGVALSRLALRLGFLPQVTTDGVTWWCAWRP